MCPAPWGVRPQRPWCDVVSEVPVRQAWMLGALEDALHDAGCPAPVARRIAQDVRLEERHGGWLALLEGHGTGVEAPVQRDERGGSDAAHRGGRRRRRRGGGRPLCAW
ncbi:hypothetical protein GCM10027261_43740 [Geodermatophilus arenarius]